MTHPNDPNPPLVAITADKMVLDIPKKMTVDQAKGVMAAAKMYSKKAFPDGMIEEAMEVLREHSNSGCA